MEEVVKFLIKVNTLKEVPRKGWVLRNVKNPEKIADHIFVVSLLSWFLAREANLNIKKVIKIALSHDLCEVYSGDITPDIYYFNLPQDYDSRVKILNKWIRLSIKEKQKAKKEQFIKEKEGLELLIKDLPQELNKEIFIHWLSFEKDVSGEGKFVNQMNRIETLIQSVEYFGSAKGSDMTAWWEWVEEIVDHPVLLEFLNVIHKTFYDEKHTLENKYKNLNGVLKLIKEANKLKKIQRLYWRLFSINDCETVAGHSFSLAILAWTFSILNKDKEKIDEEKFIKMALCHELSAIYTGDTTPYDYILNNRNNTDRDKILKRMIRLSVNEKRSIFENDYKKEKEALTRLVSFLDSKLKNEIIGLWQEYRFKKSKEAKILSQLNIVSILLQGLIYEKRYKNFSSFPLWEWAFEAIDNSFINSLLESIKKVFLQENFLK
jgi:5'-deoxynucleotidase YfbR-like HD superfamily hydrolase